MRNVHSLVGTNEPIKDVASAEAALKLHYDHRAEIDARASRLKGVVTFGHNLVDRGHSAANQVTEKLEALDREKTELQLFWEERKVSVHGALFLCPFVLVYLLCCWYILFVCLYQNSIQKNSIKSLELFLSPLMHCTFEVTVNNLSVCLELCLSVCLSVFAYSWQQLRDYNFTLKHF